MRARFFASLRMTAHEKSSDGAKKTLKTCHYPTATKLDTSGRDVIPVADRDNMEDSSLGMGFRLGNRHHVVSLGAPPFHKHLLCVTATHPNRLLLDVNATASDIERAFRVTMRVYQHPKEARRFFAPDVEPSVELGIPILASRRVVAGESR